MKKNKKSNTRQNKRAKKTNTRKVRVTKNLNIRKKKTHDDEIRTQLGYTEDFITKVNDFLMMYGSRLDKNGAESLGFHSAEIINLLNVIDKDLKDFDEEHTVLKNEAEEFFADATGNEFSWLPASVDLITRIDDLRSRYAELYVLNHQTLLTYDH